MAKNKKSSQSKPAPVRLKSPKKELEQTRKSIRKIKSPIYSLNRKIKEASSPYYARKYKKQKKEYEASIQGELNRLKDRRLELSKQYKSYVEKNEIRKSTKRKIYSIERKIEKAIDDKDIKAAEKLRYQLVKYLSQLDRLHRELGAEIEVFDKDDLDEDQGGGAGYEEDPANPYAIWEAIKKLHEDLDNGEFKYVIINGKRFSTNNPDEILLEASEFWVVLKNKKGGTPLVNRFVNTKSLSVKYQSVKFSS
jgi:hypothetical protein